MGRMQYVPTTGYVRSFEIPMRSPNRVRMALLKTVLFSFPSGPRGGAYSIRPYNRVCAIFRNTDAILQLGTCEGSKNGSVYATVGGVWWGVCNTSLRLGMCGPSKNHPVFVPFGAACGAYAIRPYNRVCAILQNTDAIPQLDTCCPSKNCPVFVPFGAVEWAYSIRPYDRVCAALQKTISFSSPTGPWGGRIQYVPTTGYVWLFEIPM